MKAGSGDDGVAGFSDSSIITNTGTAASRAAARSFSSERMGITTTSSSFSLPWWWCPRRVHGRVIAGRSRARGFRRAAGRRGPLERIFRLEKLWVELVGPQVEAADVEHPVEGNGAVPGPVDGGDGIDPSDPRFEGVELGRGDQIGLVEQKMTSAKATCFTDSSPASRCWRACLASTTVTMPSSRKLRRISSSVKKVCATGAGLARPVVSIRMPSSRSLRLRRRPRMRIRSPRTEQQMQPLFISNSSSSLAMTQLVVDADLAELILDHRQLPPVLLGQDAVEQRRLAGAEEAGEDGDGNRIGVHRELVTVNSSVGAS